MENEVCPLDGNGYSLQTTEPSGAFHTHMTSTELQEKRSSSVNK